jgi:hypothetical protein
MGMGYGAGYADVVEKPFIRMFAGKELEAFEDLVESSTEIDMNAVAQAIQYSQVDQLETADTKEVGAIKAAWARLVRKFNKATGLKLDMGYHNSGDEGGRYDDVDGPFYCVSGVWTYTKAGRKYGKHVERKMFVTFG